MTLWTFLGQENHTVLSYSQPNGPIVEKDKYIIIKYSLVFQNPYLNPKP